MNIIVVGGGKIGGSIAEALSKKHNLTVIDTDQDVVSTLSTSLDILGIIGNGASYAIQEEANIKDCQLLIAATPHDEVNILCCLIARKLASCKTIARIRNPIYKSELPYLKEELGLSMIINPEWTTANEISKILRFPDSIKVHSFLDGELELLEFAIEENSPLINLNLIEVSKQISNKILVCTVQRGEDVYIPRGTFGLHKNDIITISAKPKDAFDFFKKVGIKTNNTKNVLIIGGGKISYYLANDLDKLSINTKIIEIDKTICESLSEALPNTTIIKADASNQDALYEEGLSECDAFVTLTNLDEENIMLSLFAKKKSKAKVITKINRINYERVLEGFDIGSIIHPKELTASYISAYAEALHNSENIDVESLYNIVDGKAKALEFIVKEAHMSLCNVEIRNLKIKDGNSIVAIKHNNQIYYANGSSIININDNILVVTKSDSVHTLNDIFEI
ncbi:MAG: Trk system potassium transporter TrkA [Eubacteriales bacterium]|nr:Trk system potassium transporter TrkA [Eubacteriales bacterium]